MCMIEKGRWSSRKIKIICGIYVHWHTYNASCKKFLRKYDIYLKLQNGTMFKDTTYKNYPKLSKEILWIIKQT